MRPPTLKMPCIPEIVRGALDVRGASLVIYRRRTLIEFKTDRIAGGLTLYEENGFTSWQIGGADDHHCHVDVGLVSGVVFGAEPVTCQRGRLNYTVWFLVDDDCGNPYRPNAYFSVTLNRPYAEDGSPLREVIDPMFRLFRRFEAIEGVSAEPLFHETLVAALVS